MPNLKNYKTKEQQPPSSNLHILFLFTFAYYDTTQPKETCSTPKTATVLKPHL